ncbi:2-C-methyl-D-erythritol 2,4-cyclodiphosphate synthase [Candidatus Hydrogenedentota bacterium]
MRIGYGYDLHRLAVGRKLVLGGVEMDFSMGLAGHSDADVLSHAIGDAILGAAALGDLGSHFPDSDAQYAGISSLKLLTRISELVRNAGFEISNVDGTVIAQAPKVGPYRDEMRQNISRALGIPISGVSVKATTTEGLESTGRGEAIAASAVALIEKAET